MNNKLKAMLVLCLLLFCLTGCYPTGDVMPNNPAINFDMTGSENISSTEASEIENLKISVSFAEKYPSEAPVIKAKPREFDIENIKALLLDGKTVTEEQTIEGRNFITLTTDDDSSLTIDSDNGNITFTAEAGSDISKMQYIASLYTRQYYKRFPHIESELDGFARSEAIERADELVKMLDFKYLGEPIVYTMTAEDIHSFDDEITLSKEDEFYLVRYSTTYKEIPISLSGGDVTATAEHRSSSVDVILTKDKLVRLCGFHVIDEIEEVGTSQFKCDAQAALSQLYNYFGLMSEIEYPLEYNELKLVYITSQRDKESGELTYIPLWRFSGYEDFSEAPTEAKLNTVNKFVNPETGFVYDYLG